MNAIVKSHFKTVTGEVLGPDDVVHYVIRPTPFATHRLEGSFPAGATLAEIAVHAIPSPVRRSMMRLTIGGEEIPQALWGAVRPKPGVTVTGFVLPQMGGGGKNPLRLVAMLVLAVATVFTAGALAPVLAAAIGVSATIAGGLITAAMGLVGSLLLNALFPAKQPKMKGLSNQNDKSSPTFFLQGSRNQSAQFGIIPVVLGRHRMKPYYAALPYTEIQGDDQYLRMLFIWGHGPLNIEDIRIGETLLTNYDDYEIEHRYGYPGDTAHTLFPGTIYEDAFTIEMTAETGWVTRTTTARAKEISLDIQFPKGLAHYTKKGKREPFGATFNVEYRLSGSSDPWVKVYGPGLSDPEGPSASWSDATTSTVRRSLWWQTPAETQYDVRVQKTSGEGVEERTFGQSQWINLRSFSSENPLKMTGLATTALRIRASDQLNGIIDQLSGIVTSILPDYDYETDTWVERATSNPASLYRAILQGKGNKRPKVDAELDIITYEDWHDLNRLNAREYNQIRDFGSSVWDALSDVAAAGRASPAFRDGKWSVVIDRPQSRISQHFTPHNSWGFTGDLTYADIPDAFRVRFVNREKDWDQDERIVYRPGYSEKGEESEPGTLPAENFEGLELPGITNTEQVWQDASFHMAQGEYRNERYSIYTDIEHLVCTRGDRVKVAHDIPAWGLCTGRVKEVILDGSGNATGAILLEPVPMETGKSYAIRFRRPEDDGTSVLATLVTAPGAQAEVTFTPAIPAASKPSAGDLYMAGISSMVDRDALVLRVKPGKDMSARIFLMDYAPEVYTFGVGAAPPYDPGISPIPGNAYPVVSNVRSDETVLLRNNDGSLQERIVLTFGLVSYRTSTLKAVEIQIKHVDADESAWTTLPALDTSVRETSILDVNEGQTYNIRLRYRMENGDPGEWAPLITHLVVGKTTPPQTPVSFRINGNQLTWQYPDPELDLWGFQVRFAFGTTHLWEECQPLHPGVWADSPFILPNGLSGQLTLMVKAIDVAENLSTEPAIILTDLGDILVANVVETVDLAALNFPGTITNGYVSSNTLIADLESDLFWTTDDLGSFWSTSDSAIFWSGSSLERTWEFSFVPDPEWIGTDTKLSLNLEVTSPPSAVYLEDGGSALFWGIDDSAPFWTNDADLFWEDPVSWVPWLGQIIGVTTQLYKWKVVTPAAPEGSATNISIASITVDVPDLTERLDDVVLDAITGSRLPITQPFKRIKNVSLTLQDDGSSAAWAGWVDKDHLLGPLCRAYNYDRTAVVAGTVDATIQGY